MVRLPSGLKQEFTLSRATVVIGRHVDCDIVVPDDAISRAHVRIDRTADGFTVTDLGSSNGTRVNGEPASRRILASGDVVHIGDTFLRFETGPADDGPEHHRIDTERDLRATLQDIRLPVLLEENDGPRIAVHTPDKTWEVPLTGDCVTIGRGSENDVILDYLGVSRHHAVVERRDELYDVRDLASQNGTWMASDRIARTVLNDGDTFRIGPAAFVFKVGRARADEVEDGRGRHGGRRPVVVIPGFAGSNLWLGDQQVWPSLKLLSHPDLLGLDHPLEARGILDQVVVIPNLLTLDQYSALTDYLRENLGYEVGVDLLEFGYDFRQDNRQSAKLLAAAIAAWDPSLPITIIAHSMGCLIARYYIERLGGRHRTERVILLGGPHAGTPYAFASLLTGPNLLPLGMMNVRLREQLATFPSWYQILPTYPCVSGRQTPLDVLADESWVSERHRPLLRSAREFRQELGTHSSVPAVCIFGYGIKTVAEESIERDQSGAVGKADFRFTEGGDGTIPERSAILKGAEIHPVRQHHGSLYVDSDVRMRLKLELTRPAAADASR
ncbi:MAG: FHA domain-containing protein [Gemmatimonadaceae bacterium]